MPQETHRYYYRYPGDFYAIGPTTEYYSSPEEVREALNLNEEVEVWPYHDSRAARGWDPLDKDQMDYFHHM